MYNERIPGPEKFIHLPDQKDNSVSERTKDRLNCPPLLYFNVILSQAYKTKIDLLIIYISTNGLNVFKGIINNIRTVSFRLESKI